MWLPFEALYSSNLTLATGFQWLIVRCGMIQIQTKEPIKSIRIAFSFAIAGTNYIVKYYRKHFFFLLNGNILKY